ncbi:hypothetical protein COLO4_07322 [Corchorus olitorius]|uniref:Uncharacterized protein n=1 Tax=Corchorus olitorius TaxID=93759 RepID=A0A1R3KK50_9ROSI|nr:hypothetical protein COLO4_07322 [Corchorus olitorius]
MSCAENPSLPQQCRHYQLSQPSSPSTTETTCTESVKFEREVREGERSFVGKISVEGKSSGEWE